MSITKLVFCVRKRPELSNDDFQRYWLERHGPLVRSLYESGSFPGMLRYVQSHTLFGEPSDRLRASRGSAPAFEGITEVWFDTDKQGGDEAVRDASARAGKLLFDDESTFIDFANSVVFMTSEHTIFDGSGAAAPAAISPNHEGATAAEDVDANTRVKSRYFRFLDTKQWDRFADLFTSDAVLDTSEEMVRLGMDPALGMAYGSEAIAEYVGAAVAGVVTVHHGHMNEVELTGPDTADAVWAMEDKLWWPEGAALKHVHGYGHYYETYQRCPDGKWRIKTLRLTRLRVDTEMA
jgi:hypothetical protein